MSDVSPVKGMHDLVHPESSLFRAAEDCLIEILSSFGYQEIRLPILERTELFRRSVGESTDIVEKEMYSFTDQGGDELSLRPEGTAGCVRAALQKGLIRAGRTVRLWYSGPFFRRERPQKGRYRQFHQLAGEVYGLPDANAEAELILSNFLSWQRLHCASELSLKINTLGSAEERAHYRTRLIDYLSARQSALDENARRRLNSNPLRVLDSKDERVRAVLEEAPKLIDFLGSESRAHFDRLQTLLESAGVRYELDPFMVRGLDYYTQTVFEWVRPGESGPLTVCAGGRYDNLITQLGGAAPVPAAGFALGIERLLALMKPEQTAEMDDRAAAVYVVSTSARAEEFVWRFIADLRRSLPGHKLLVHYGGGSLSSQLKHAHKSKALLALIVGDQEMQADAVGLKFLRSDQAQEKVAVKDLPKRLQSLLA